MKLNKPFSLAADVYLENRSAFAKSWSELLRDTSTRATGATDARESDR